VIEVLACLRLSLDGRPTAEWVMFGALHLGPPGTVAAFVARGDSPMEAVVGMARGLREAQLQNAARYN